MINLDDLKRETRHVLCVKQTIDKGAVELAIDYLASRGYFSQIPEESHSPELTPSGELNTSYGCKCMFTDDICVDICAYHQDLENTNKAHEKNIDKLVRKLAEYHNASIGYTPQKTPKGVKND